MQALNITPERLAEILDRYPTLDTVFFAFMTGHVTQEEHAAAVDAILAQTLGK